MEKEIAVKPKWEAMVSTRVANANADQIWPLIQDFFGINRYFSNLETSYGILGNNGEVGSIRYCEGLKELSSQEDDQKQPAQPQQPPPVAWAKEKIIAVDPTQRSLTYEIVDSNIGFHSYVSTLKVGMSFAAKSGGGGGDGGESGTGCVMEWSFSVDPVEGFTFEGLVEQFQVWLKFIAKNMEDSLMKINAMDESKSVIS